jgi:ABC-type Fe3+ transport system substrate-binding protein
MHKILALLALGMFSASAFAADTLVILSPHRKSIQDEFVPVFQKHYKDTYKTDVKVDWIDQGGTSNNIRFLRTKIAGNPKAPGIDVFWGGGTAAFVELSRDKVLEQFKLPAELLKQVPKAAAGVPLYDATNTWYASAMSSFGIFYNKKLLKIQKIPEPKTWEDLANPALNGKISLADPRQSGSANSMNTIIVQSLGWDKGWEILTAQGANNRHWTHSSSDPIKAIVSGDASVAPAIDFYALAKIGDLGADNLGFSLPEGKTVIDPDPVAIIKGSANRTPAERFVTWLVSADAQKLLILPKGTPGGPKLESLGRMAVNTETYAQTESLNLAGMNPFKQKEFFKLDVDKAAKMKRPFDDLVGAVLVDTHKELREAWARIIKNGSNPADIAALGKPPVTEAELLALAAKWDDNKLRNETINKWVEFARAKYAKIGSQSH